ncbi:glycosyltransferase [Paenibacillus alba]|uniref:glycosyltransferase n=1 Tax=Paenibacillus alba TaxID=1197127 RepID=UPI001565D836|nr:glycosyltransferase [Paenibacillus alba]NQX70105.1 glycosyltransferase [Paenibacillus alba]
MPFLSLCMIVKDEAKHLDKCLQSVSNCVDEIIIVDTGSTDSTKEIATRYTPYVIDFAWKQDFAAARNASILHAKGKWILYLDADEFINPEFATDLLRFLEKLPSDVPTGVIVPIYNYVGESNSGKISESKAMRIFSNNRQIYFVRPIHEQLLCTDGVLQEVEFSFPIYHTGYLQEVIEAKDKSSRNMAIFDLMSRQGNLSCYDWFTLGNEYTVQGLYQKALECYEQAHQPSEMQKSWLPLCIGNMINCCINLEKYLEAYQHVLTAQKTWHDACDFYWLQGYLLARLGLDSFAIETLRTCIRLGDNSEQLESNKVLISPNNASSLPLQQLSVLHIRNFDFQEAVTTLSKLLYVAPNNKMVLKQLLQILLSFGESEGLESLLRSFYPLPQSYQLIMILELCIELGSKPLSTSYLNICTEQCVELPARLELQYAILHEDALLFGRLKPNQPTAELDIDIAFMSFLLWGGNLPEVGKQPRDIDWLAQTYMRFFYAEQFACCDRLIEQYHSSSLLNVLGNNFFKDRQYELAMDYYSTLLNQNALSAEGYENVGRLYIAQGDVSEGITYIRQAIELSPMNITLYTYLLQHLTETSEQENIKLTLMDKYPGLNHFPLL